TLLVYFSPTGFAGEWWHEGHARALGYSSGALDLLLTISGVEGTLWRRVTTAGALVQELVIPSEAITLDVRGDRVVFAGNDGEPYADYVAMLDLAGVELWRHEQLDGVPFSVQGLALGPSGELALNARSSAPSFDRLFMMAPDGTIEWTHDLDFEGFGVVTVDMEIGDDGAVVLVGRGSWSTPEDDYVSPAWIARYAGPSE
ncbi:MAG: hypothetical protein KDK70_23135, partial [Myxococcales bacterium]|nr:hypothetical protein [Myxococcales bacterium]